MRALAFVALAAAACTTDQSIGQVTAHVIADSHKLDVLFVIDQSDSMIGKQMELAANLPRFMDQLTGLPGGLPSVHIGVITTDVGVGARDVSPADGCTASGDGGELQSQPRVAGCTPPDGAFISDEIDGAGNRVRNYSGTLEDTFACIGLVGAGGCGYEQPFASMRLALGGTVAKNAGFLRDDAFLVVVFISDEDDCSASDPDTLFDPSPVADGKLGFGSYRCTRYGLICDGQVPDHPGSYQHCVSQPSSLVAEAGEFVDFLKSIKDERAIYIATLAGDPTPVTVAADPIDSTFLELQGSCNANGIEANPGVRLGELGAAFANHAFRSLCSDAVPDVLGSVGTAVKSMIVSYAKDPGGDVSLSYGCQVGGGAGGAVSALLVGLALGAARLARGRRRGSRASRRCTPRARCR